MNSKKITKSGSIGIPVGLRREMGIQPGDAYEIRENPDGSLTLLPYNVRCVFCGAADDVAVYRGRGICRVCLQEVEGRLEHV